MRARIPPVALVLLALLAPGHRAAALGAGSVRGCVAPATPAVPPPAAPPLARLVVIGDFGTGEHGRNAAVAAAVRRYADGAVPPPERVLALGDNFYEDGLLGAGVRCGDPAPPGAVAAQARAVVGPWTFLRDRGIPLTLLPGNHDYHCEPPGLANQIRLDAHLPPAERWGPAWEVVHGPPRVLPVGAGAVRLIALDSERMIADDAFRAGSAAALEALLRGAAADGTPWALLAMHHPLRTHGTHGSTGWRGTAIRGAALLVFPSHLLAAWRVPVFDEMNQQSWGVRYRRYRRAVEEAIRRSGVPVALAMAGHDHQLQLLAPAAPGQPHVLVSGSAARCSPVWRGPDTLFAAPKHGFAVVDVHPDSLAVEFHGTTPCADTRPCGPPDGGGPHLLGRFVIPAAGGAAAPVPFSD